MRVTPTEFVQLRLGTLYGGWTFLDHPSLQNATVISCGLGEDASFDVAFAKRYRANVLIVDPTPRAIRHFQAIQVRLGCPSETPFISGGNQPPNAYDLTGITHAQWSLIPKAMWISKDSLKFFSPPDITHVSHSIFNMQQPGHTETPHIWVDAITPKALRDDFHLSQIPLLKMDIEGAEPAVIRYLIAEQILPIQLLVEYDGMHFPTHENRAAIRSTHAALLTAGYQLIAKNGANCSYFYNASQV